jgi:two-component system LytT family sensor kinase
MLILKLSSMLRRRLRHDEPFVTLREELASVDEYLDIEAVRFGPQLRIEKDIQAETLDRVVPSMMLQPIVENSIKHGIALKVGGGRITIRSRRERGRTVIEVEDNGQGMTGERLDQVFGGTDPSGSGIGLRNVSERLRVVYGDHAGLELRSEPGRGTVARLEIPDAADAADVRGARA